MTPPAHLLPLALEAMHSADACEVLGDALIESGWCDWRIGYVRGGDPLPATPLAGDLSWARHVICLVVEYPRVSDVGKRVRAIAAVLLFGEWSTERWPLVEAHEVRRNPWALARPGSYFGINREEPPTRLAGALADVWAQELDGAMRRYSRDLSYAMTARMYAPSSVSIQHPDDEEDDDADLG